LRHCTSCAPSMLNPPTGELVVEFAKAVTVRAHPSTDDAQLDLKEGDIVYVLERDDSGWWGGHKDGEDNTGWFPGSCVRALPEQNEVEVPAQVPTQIADQVNFEAEHGSATARPEFSVATFEANTARDVSPEQSFIESPRRPVHDRRQFPATTPTPLVETCGDLPTGELQARIRAKDQEISDLRSEVAESKRKERQSDADLREHKYRLKEVEDVERKRAKELTAKNDQLARQVNEHQDLAAQMKQKMDEKESSLQSALQALQHAKSQAQSAQRRPSESLQDPPVAQLVPDDYAPRQLFARQEKRDSSASQRLCWQMPSTNPDEQSSNSDAQSSHREPGGHTRVTGTPISEQKELPPAGTVSHIKNVFEQRCTTQSPNRNFIPEPLRRGPHGSPVATPTGAWRSGSRTRTQDSLRSTPTCTTKTSLAHSRPLPCIDLVLPPPETDDPTDDGAVVLGMSPIRSARPTSKMPTPATQAQHRDGSPPRLPVAAHRSPNPRESAVSETSVRDRVRMFCR